MATKKIQANFRLDPSTLKILKRLARKERVSQAAIITALVSAIEIRENRRQERRQERKSA